MIQLWRRAFFCELCTGMREVSVTDGMSGVYNSYLETSNATL